MAQKTIILYRKDRIQPHTLDAIRDALAAKDPVAMIGVDVSELDGIETFVLETQALKKAFPKETQKPKPQPKPEPETAAERLQEL